MKAEFPIWNPWLWPVLAATYTGEAALRTLNGSLTAVPVEPAGPEPAWTTLHTVRLELPTLRVREFSYQAGGVPTLVVAPFALHGAALADFAPGHSLVESLLSEGLVSVCVVECKSALPSMRFLSIDNYLADLAVVVQDLGGLVNLIGLCQGGWLSLMFAARFPQMIHSIALAGSPIDLAAAPSSMVTSTCATAPEVFEGLVRSGDGLIVGQRMLDLWGSLFRIGPQQPRSYRLVRMRWKTCSSATGSGINGPSTFLASSILRSWSICSGATNSPGASFRPWADRLIFRLLRPRCFFSPASATTSRHLLNSLRSVIWLAPLLGGSEQPSHDAVTCRCSWESEPCSRNGARSPDRCEPSAGRADGAGWHSGDRVAVIDLGEQGSLGEQLASPCGVERHQMVIHGPAHAPDPTALDSVDCRRRILLAEQDIASGGLAELSSYP
jgi:pimeloyl-ACP methyl ester carboxylesterase